MDHTDQAFKTNRPFDKRVEGRLSGSGSSDGQEVGDVMKLISEFPDKDLVDFVAKCLKNRDELQRFWEFAKPLEWSFCESTNHDMRETPLYLETYTSEFGGYEYCVSRYSYSKEDLKEQKWSVLVSTEHSGSGGCAVYETAEAAKDWCLSRNQFFNFLDVSRFERRE